jgi:hypothetical protein
MPENSLRYYALGSATGLTIVGWLLDKLPPEVGQAVIAAVAVIAGADMIKHRNG